VAGAAPAPAGSVSVSPDIASPDWDGYLAAHPEATSDHLWGWRHIFENVLGHRTVYLAAHRGSQVVGVLPLVLLQSRLFGRSVTSLPALNSGGIVADDVPAARALLEQAERIARSFGAAHLELRHARRQFDHLPFRQHKLAFRRELPATSEALWAGTDRKVRNQVRKAQKSGLEPVRGGVELLEDFYRVFAENMRDLGTPVYPRRLFEDVLRLFPLGARVTLVRLKRTPLAGAVSIRWRDTMLVPWASSLRKHRPLCPNMLLYWALLEQAIAEGVRVFDFGRSSPDSGSQQFKRQWGATETPLTWEYLLLSGDRLPDQGPSNPRFQLAIAAWKRLPLGIANRLGPWIAAQLA
jgi:FemAB-related protein (PEP-CTERM system-associated)